MLAFHLFGLDWKTCLVGDAVFWRMHEKDYPVIRASLKLKGELERLSWSRVKSFKSSQPKFLGYKSLRSNQFRQCTHHRAYWQGEDQNRAFGTKINLACRVRSRLSLGLKLSLSSGLCILSKDLTWFLQSPFFLVKLWKALLAGWRRIKIVYLLSQRRTEVKGKVYSGGLLNIPF